MKITVVLVYGLALALLPLLGRAEVLRGRVQDKGGEPIVGATIVCLRDAGKGCTTDSEGFFALDSSGMCDSVYVSHILYEGVVVSVHSVASQDTVRITLVEKSYEVESVAVMGRLPIARQVAVTRVSEMDIYLDPAAQGDPLKAITSLAASTATTEMANPEFRGSPAGYAMVTLNKVPIENPVRYGQLNGLGLFSLFHPSLIDSEWVYPSNPPVTVGKAISGLIDVRTKERLYRNSSYVSVGLGGLGGVVSRRFRSDESFLQIYANWQASNALKALMPGALPEVKNFYAGDLGVNLRVRLSSRMHLNWYAYGVYDRFHGESGSMNYYGAVRMHRWRFFSIINLSHTHAHGGITSLNLGGDWNAPRTTMGNLDVMEKRRRLYASVDHRILFRWMELEGGISWEGYAYAYMGVLPKYYLLMGEQFPQESVNSKNSNGTADGYLFANFPIKDGLLNVSLGAKLIGPTRKGGTPAYNAQIMLRALVTPQHSLLFAAGHYEAFTGVTVYSPLPRLLRSDQVNLDYDYRTEDLLLKAAAFWKRESVYVESYAGALREVSVAMLPSWGGELTWEHQFATYWNYNLMWSAFRRKPLIAMVGIGERAEWMYFGRVAVQYSNPSLFSLSLSYGLHRGVYIPRVRGASYVAEVNAFLPNRMSEERSKLYQRVDVLVSKQLTFRKCSISMFALVNNVFNWKNIREYYYSNDYQHAYPLHLQLRNFYLGVIFMF